MNYCSLVLNPIENMWKHKKVLGAIYIKIPRVWKKKFRLMDSLGNYNGYNWQDLWGEGRRIWISRTENYQALFLIKF